MAPSYKTGRQRVNFKKPFPLVYFFLNLRANCRSLKSLKPYAIPFTGLKLGKHQYQFEVNDAFFNEFEYSLVKNGNLSCQVELDKQETMLILQFNITGNIALPCDRCLADFKYPVNVTERQIVKFGDEDEEVLDDDDILVIGRHEFEINVAGLIYEYINVSVPFISVCTDDGAGEFCDKEMLDRLAKLASGNEEEKITEADPRWDALKNLNK